MITESLEKYKQVSQRLGLADDTETYDPDTTKLPENKNTIVFSADPLESDIPPLIIPTASIAHLNKIIGRPDDGDDQEVNYPPPLSEVMDSKLINSQGIRAFLHALTVDDYKIIKMAAEAYLLGDSRKVKDYEPLINATSFPGRVAYFATLKDIVLPTNIEIKGEDPIIWNYRSIKTKDKTTLRVQVPMIITANDFCGEGDTINDLVINCSAENFTQAARPGIQGQTGVSGVAGNPAICRPDPNHPSHPMVCLQAPMDGGQGGVGVRGGVGFNGGVGQAQAPFHMTVETSLMANLIIIAGGGDGQDGGQGGTGGLGGDGGPAGENCQPCPAAKKGEQGNGGDGGRGGNGGDGGDGATVQIFYGTFEGEVEIQRKQSKAGDPGIGGNPGRGNENGKPGEKGAIGNPGKPSKVQILPILDV